MRQTFSCVNRLVALLTPLASMFLAHQAAAQEQTTSSAALEEVTVTARRVAENLQTTPIAISYFSGDTLEKLQVTHIEDLQYQMPSLVVTQGSEGSVPSSFGLRGLYDTSETHVQPTVVTYLDQVPVFGEMIARQMFDLESIQVLTGPQGTLFGSNSNGGAILFTTHKPTDHYEGWVEVGAGLYSERDATAVLNLPLFDTFQMRVAAKFVSRNGYTTQLNPCPYDIVGIAPPPVGQQVEPFTCSRGGNLDDEKYRTFRASAAWQISKSVDNDTLFYYYYSNQTGASSIPYKIGGPQSLVDIDFFPGNPGNFPTGPETLAQQQQYGVRKVWTDGANWWNTSIWGASNVTTIRLGDVTFKNIYGYRQQNTSWEQDNDGSILPLTYEQNQSAGAKYTNSDEVQILGSHAHNQFSWIIGGYFERYKDPGYRPGGGDWLYYGTSELVAQYQAIGLGCCFFAGSLANYFNVVNTIHTNAGYANATFDLSHFLPGVRLSAGVRETWVDSIDYTHMDEIVPCPLVPTRNSSVQPPCTQVSESNTNGTNWSATIDYQATDKVFLYFTSRHGFKPGGVNSAVENPAYFTFAPESITDFELGLKSEFHLGSMAARLNIAAFTSNYTDIQRQEYVSQPPPLPVASVVLNAQKARISGLEPNLTLQVTENLLLRVDYAYLNAKFIEFTVPNPYGPGTLDYSQNAFAGAPKNTVSINASYDLPFGDRSAVGTFTLAADYFYRSPTTYSEGDSIVHGPDVFNPGFGVTNARLVWASPNHTLELTAAVNNVFNKVYITGNNDYTDSIVGWAHRWYGPPIMYRISAKYSFGAK